MTNFLNNYPDTKYRKRVLYDMGNVAFGESWRITGGGGYPSSAAVPYLNLARDWFSGVVANETNGISAADAQQAQLGIMRTYYIQRDFGNLSSYAAQIITNFPPGGKEWLAIKLFDASGLSCQKKFTEANKEFDEMLATGFKGNPSYDGFLVAAADWHARISSSTGDEAGARRVVQMVLNSNCYDSLKRAYASRFQWLINQPSPTSK